MAEPCAAACRAAAARRLEKLWARIGGDVERFGWFQAGGAGGGSLQRGALRVNCIDCLDRTNVVQGWLARKQLERLLAQLGLVAPGTPLPEAFPEARHASLLPGGRQPPCLVHTVLPWWRAHSRSVVRELNTCAAALFR